MEPIGLAGRPATALLATKAWRSRTMSSRGGALRGKAGARNLLGEPARDKDVLKSSRNRLTLTPNFSSSSFCVSSCRPSKMPASLRARRKVRTCSRLGSSRS